VAARHPWPDRRLLAAALLLAAATALLARPPATVRLEAGHVVGGMLPGRWDASDRTDVDHEVAALDTSITGIGHFRFRTAHPRASIDIPVRPRGGELRLRLRTLARVRTVVAFHSGGRPAGEMTVLRGPWRIHEVVLRGHSAGDTFPLDLTLRPMPQVRVPEGHVTQPKLWVADIEVSAPSGLAFAPRARLLLALVPLALFAFAWAVGTGPRLALAAAALGVVATVGLAATAPLPLLVAVPRLVLPALGLGLLTGVVLGRLSGVPPGARAALSSLVAAGIVFHASLPFVPGYDPYDVEVHVRRARDLGLVSFEYGSLLLYGSHLPTPTQTFGTATLALGDRILIPYSPLPYLVYYPLHRLGLDLHWSMAFVDAALAMAVVPLLWLVAVRAWNAGAAWTGVALYTLDLPIWHHLGRGHYPASFGSALGAAALLHLAYHAGHLDTLRRVALAAAVVAVAVLGYSSLIVLFGLFGLCLAAVLALDAAGLSRRAKVGLLASLVMGAFAAFVLFYLHYLPGLVHGATTIQAEADPFPPRTFWIFHNESRQSMRVWAAGFALPLAAAALAAPFALRRARPGTRPVLVAWVLSFPLVMLAKEPFLFPRPMRWAKEDQFIAPALALVIGGAASALPRPWMRWTAAAIVVLAALWLQLGDFRAHARSLL
jgi:hypothetical protein